MNEWLGRPTLTGRVVTLRPLATDDASALAAAVDDPSVFRWTPAPATDEAAERYVQAAHNNPGRVALAVVENGPVENGPVENSTVENSTAENSAGLVVGTTSFYDIDPSNRSLAIGYTFYASRCHGTSVNPESKLLLLEHAFEQCGAVRVVWHTDERNARSRAAIAKLGATFEGLLRKHRPAVDGGWRTTAQYSMTDDDWVEVKAGLRRRLHRR